jgi:Uma2 family endonuclease
VYNNVGGGVTMKSPTSEKNIRYSYRDYLTWDQDERWELIEGIPYNMTPAPSSKHQEILGNIFVLFYQYLSGRRCKAYLAPFEVRLSDEESDEQTFNVVQPDLSIICDPKKIDERGCKGSPDLIVEVLSPGIAAKRDKIIKFELYQKYKIKEYWIVDPFNENVEVYLLKDDSFSNRQVYVKGDVFTVSIFTDLLIDMNRIFKDESFE